MLSFDTTLASVQDYYGRVLKSNADLQTTACCTAESLPLHVREIAGRLHDEVVTRFYGCGSPLPFELAGRTVLDLGSGSGRDAFILSKLVGPEGKVIGVDMTEEQLAVARAHVQFHTEAWGYAKPNVDFRQGFIEDLASAGIADNSVDVVISNCVINLSPDKKRVFAEIFRVLKPGGELFFSDVFASRRLSREASEDPVLVGECLGGAMYVEDFRRLLAELGCADYRILARSPIELTNPALADKFGLTRFFSLTVRAFKLAVEDRCEDYGEIAIYDGTIEHSPNAFRLDDHHLFEKGRPMAVCTNTADMLMKTRYARHFRVLGERTTHYGLFDCGPTPVTDTTGGGEGACC